MNADNSCCCRKLLANPKLFGIWLVYGLIVLVMLSLVVGSFCESEPTAGKMFLLLTVALAVVLGALAWRLSKRFGA